MEGAALTTGDWSVTIAVTTMTDNDDD